LHAQQNEIANEKLAHLTRHGAEHGAVTGSVAVDMATVRRRKREMVERQIAAHLQNYKASGAELIIGYGRFVAPKTLEVILNDGGTRVLAGGRVFLNVGTHAAIPNVPGLEAAKPLTHVEVLALDYLPQHLIVIGGGYSGLDGTGLSSLWQRHDYRRVRASGGGANRHDSRAAIFEARQCCFGPPDDGRRPQHAFLKHTASVGSTDHARKSRTGREFRFLIPYSMQRPRSEQAAHQLIPNGCEG
jgi:hypothetical protein